MGVCLEENPGASAMTGAPLRRRSGLWRGPELVLLQTGHTVFVTMRSRLCKCSVEQVRSATSDEVMGAELVTKGQFHDLLLYLKGTRGVSAIDLEKEGAPPSDADTHPQSDEVSGGLVGPVEAEGLGGSRALSTQLAPRLHELPRRRG